jgi:hypothetical protein
VTIDGLSHGVDDPEAPEHHPAGPGPAAQGWARPPESTTWQSRQATGPRHDERRRGRVHRRRIPGHPLDIREDRSYSPRRRSSGRGMVTGAQEGRGGRGESIPKAEQAAWEMLGHAIRGENEGLVVHEDL